MDVPSNALSWVSSSVARDIQISSVAIIQACLTIALGYSTYLFFFRIRAVFHNSRPAIVFFTLLRLTLSAGVALQAAAPSGAHIGPTQECTVVAFKPWAAAGPLIVAFNDTLVIFSVSWRLLRDSLADTWGLKLKAIRKGHGVGPVSRVLMKTGQQYYIVTIWINICTAVIILLPSISPTIREIVTYPSVAIINIMASRAFQQLRIETLNGCVTTFSIEADPSGRGHHNLSTVDIELQFASPSSLQSPVVSGEASDNPRRSSSSYGWSKTGTLSEA
ncbi:hypothetical protein NLI96_g8363 [Meripilus lineatus]|uniref:Uncharacterized protein n=1 Tax=Meripilus lineatus TaxID=2056292 RepID=A0AAD5UXG8_9APHY|nr:hypothetical protein NLI96_g8363 [Physisporinus lineatus]